jgi:hypothetical protein
MIEHDPSLDPDLAIFLGLPIWKTSVDKEVAERFKIIQESLSKKDGEFLYGDNRTKPEHLGWRFVQIVRLYKTDPEILKVQIQTGVWDEHIEEAWHTAAAVEWYYAQRSYNAL